MNAHRVLSIAARVAGIGAIAFISVFALDVFEPGVPVARILLALTVHLIPSAVLALLLAFAWRYERIGGLVFIVLSALPFFLLRNELMVNATLSVPFFLTGALFLASSYFSEQR